MAWPSCKIVARFKRDKVYSEGAEGAANRAEEELVEGALNSTTFAYTGCKPRLLLTHAGCKPRM